MPQQYLGKRERKCNLFHRALTSMKYINVKRWHDQKSHLEDCRKLLVLCFHQKELLANPNNNLVRKH